MYWEAAKRYSRNNCALNHVSLLEIRAFARKSFRYMDAYRKDMLLKSIKDIVRIIPNNVLQDILIKI